MQVNDEFVEHVTSATRGRLLERLARDEGAAGLGGGWRVTMHTPAGDGVGAGDAARARREAGRGEAR